MKKNKKSKIFWEKVEASCFLFPYFKEEVKNKINTQKEQFNLSDSRIIGRPNF